MQAWSLLGDSFFTELKSVTSPSLQNMARPDVPGGGGGVGNIRTDADEDLARARARLRRQVVNEDDEVCINLI